MRCRGPRYARHAQSPNGEAEKAIGATGHRHGHRSRSLPGSFGRVEIEVPRARLNTPDGKTTEWKSKARRAYHWLCRQASDRGLMAQK
jgi:putative transposase